MTPGELQEGLEAYADAIASLVTARVVKALQANAPFTAEDIERIKDHVHPQGVAFWNGYKHAMEVLWNADEHAAELVLEEHLKLRQQAPKVG